MRQTDMPIMGPTRGMRMLPDEWIEMCSSRQQAIQLCVQASGLTNSVIAEELGIDKGQFTRIMSGTSHLPDSKDDQLMWVCGNWAPLQYSCQRNGFTLSAGDPDGPITDQDISGAQMYGRRHGDEVIAA